MKTFYKVRIDEGLRLLFVDKVPWGYQGKVLESLMAIMLEQCKAEGDTLAVAKLIDGRYTLKETKR